LAGLASTEFPPHLVAAHLVSTVFGRRADKLTLPVLSRRCAAVLDDALRGEFGGDYRELSRRAVPRRPDPANLLRSTTYHRRYASTTSNIAYGPHTRANRLDIWRASDQPTDSHAPVLVQIPGGGWTINDKRGQAYPLMGRMVEDGWVCVSIDYRRSPHHAWPAHILDVKRAIAWVRDNIAAYGGDPGFIAVTGGSAGAHLGALAALTPNDSDLQPEFEDADTSLQAAVPLYGVYDLADPAKMRPAMLPLLERTVFHRRLGKAPRLFAAASPISHVSAGAPPFFVMHGRNDSLIPCAQARAFSTALRLAGARPVCYAELPHAEHGFDLLASVRCQLVTDAIAQFLGIVYAQHTARQDGRVTSSAG
jgi:acetyl esterase/lipase